MNDYRLRLELTHDSELTVEEKREQTSSIQWWHTMDLGDGVVTNGNDDSPAKEKEWKISPQIFKGKTVLDIGAWDGYFSFQAEQSGASEVTALDMEEKEGFKLAHRAYNSKVKYIIQDINTATPEQVGKFDIVLYFGVLYHMRFPYLSLCKVADLVKPEGLLLLETHIGDDLHGGDGSTPMMDFYPSNELNNDPTNWWGPNNQCVRQMLETLDFAVYNSRKTASSRRLYHASKVAIPLSWNEEAK